LTDPGPYHDKSDDPAYIPPAPVCDGGEWLAQHIKRNLLELMGEELWEMVEDRME